MNDLTTVVQNGGLATLEPGHYLCTLDPRERANRQLMAVAVQQGVLSLMEAINLEIDVSHVLIHRIDVVDKESGEVKRLTRFVVLGQDGKMWSSCGRKALNDLLFPAQLFGLALPYNPPQRFRVRRAKVKEGEGYYLALDWIDTEAPTKKVK